MLEASFFLILGLITSAATASADDAPDFKYRYFCHDGLSAKMDVFISGVSAFRAEYAAEIPAGFTDANVANMMLTRSVYACAERLSRDPEAMTAIDHALSYDAAWQAFQTTCAHERRAAACITREGTKTR